MIHNLPRLSVQVRMIHSLNVGYQLDILLLDFKQMPRAEMTSEIGKGVKN